MPLRSRRTKTQKPKYKDSDDSEDDRKDFEDSGSEASIPDNHGSEESSDDISGNDFETDAEDKPSRNKKLTKKSRKSASTAKVVDKKDKVISMDKIKRNLQSAGLKHDSTQEGSALDEVKISIKDMTEQEKLLPTFLNLSESDSDSNDEDKLKKRSSTYTENALDLDAIIAKEAQTISGTSQIKATIDKPGRLSDTDSEMEDVDEQQATNVVEDNSEKIIAPTDHKLDFQHLHDHVQRMEEAKQSLEQYKKRNSTLATKQDVLKVDDLLAMGESEVVGDKEAMSDYDDSDSDVEDLEEVKGDMKSTIPKGGLQLVLDLPNDRPRQKKKQLDIEMMMKRRLNRVKKEHQVFIHRVHVLCWLGYGNHVNAAINEQNVMAAALSLIPSEKCYPDNRVDIKYLEQITKWYQSTMILKEDKHQNKFRPNKKSLILELLQQISKKTVTSKKVLAFIFVAMLRALGIKCRLVLSFRVAPLRPPELLSLSLKNKDDPKKDKSEKSTVKCDVQNKESSSQTKLKKESETKKKAVKSKDKIDPNDKIPQLDGADDRIPKDSTRSQKKRSISLNKVPIKQPKLEPSASSYWDQLVQNVEETPKNPKRISHRELKMERSPRNTPPKVKVELESPVNKSIFDESTLLTSSNKKLFTDSTLSLPNSSKTSLNSSKHDDSSSSHNVTSSSNVTGSKRRSLSLANSNEKNSKTRKKPNETNGKKNDEIVSKETLSVPAMTRSRNACKDSAIFCNKKVEGNKASSKTPTTKKMEVDKAKTEVLKVSSRPRRLTDQPPSTSQASSVETTKSRRSLKDRIEKGKNESFTVDKKENGLSDKKTNTRSKSASKAKETVSNKKDDKEVKKETKSKSKKSVKEVSKYFSPDKMVDKDKAPTKGVRVSHRDLAAKSQLAALSPKKDATKDLIGLIKDRVRESKDVAKSKLVKGKAKNDSDDDSDYVEEKQAPKARTVSETSDADFRPSKRKSLPVKKAKDRRVLSSDDENVLTKKRGVDVWCEVYVEEGEQWMSVDVVKAQVHCPNEIYSRSSHPITYIVSWDNNCYIKDVTRRYVPHWNTTTRKLRTDTAWYDKAIRPWLAPPSLTDAIEDRQLDRMQLDAPLPTSIAEFKNHPLYVLKRHLLKFEALYPPDTPTVGFIRNEPVYPRDCVYICRSRETWVKEAKVVKPGEQPYKIVKARPKYDRLSGNLIKDIPLEVFGPWQVEDYVPPAAENGIVPRNAYGNVELFKTCMLPKGTVHLQLPGLNKVAKKLNIDCAPAMTGFDYHSGWCHPVYDGFVVCEEYKDQIIQAWEQEQEEAEARATEKIEKRVYGNWKRLIKGLLIREKLKAKYDFQDVQDVSLGGGKGKKRSKGPRFVAKKRRSCERSSESDSS